MMRRLRRKNGALGQVRPGLRSNLNYQYSQKTQIMGPGTIFKNFEEEIGVLRNVLSIYDLNSFLLDDDVDTTFRSYKYVKLIGVLVTQQQLNMQDEQNAVYINVDWTSRLEEINDIEKDDATKVLPNLGSKNFMFIPPNAQIPTLFDNQEYRYLNLRNFLPCESLYQVGPDNFRLPGRIGVYNKTDSPRILRVIIRMEFRGSRVVDKEEESKNYLIKKGYQVIPPSNKNLLNSCANSFISEEKERENTNNSKEESEKTAKTIIDTKDKSKVNINYVEADKRNRLGLSSHCHPSGVDLGKSAISELNHQTNSEESLKEINFN